MSEVTVLIDAEKIQHEVTQAILDSAIGKQLKKTLEELAKKWNVGGYWNNTLTKIVEDEVNSVIRTKVREAIIPYLETNVPKLITPSLLEELTTAAMSSLKVGSHF